MTVLIVLGTAVLYMVAYHTYGRFLGRKIFQLSVTDETPAHTLNDDCDYVPTRRFILFGHHYTSIAGTGPIVGPAIAVIWGWLPALLWILVGSIFMGAVHDFGALILSARNQGKSVGEISGMLLGRTTRILFLLIIFITLLIIVAIFGLVIVSIFELYPQSVIPVWSQIPIAVALGYYFRKTDANRTVGAILAVALMYAAIVLGAFVPVQMPALGPIPPLLTWLVILYIYAYTASILPVWQLLQPRDYLNSIQLIAAMTLLVAAIFYVRPPMDAPPVIWSPSGAPPIFPFLFITIACGAISGFHSLVGSGTSSKQLDREPDALPIGYGGMLLEGVLAMLVVVAATAGLGLHYESVWFFPNAPNLELVGAEAFTHHYASWGAAAGLGVKVGAFVHGAANILEGMYIPRNISIAIMGMFVASFAGTTLDTASRIQRYIVSELATTARVRPLQGPKSATAFAVISAAVLAFAPIKSADGSWVFGKGGLILWPLFGTSNQLLAALSLAVVTVYLVRRNVNRWITLIPMLIMFVVSTWAILLNLHGFFNTGQYHLLLLSVAMLVVDFMVIGVSAKAFTAKSRDNSYRTPPSA